VSRQSESSVRKNRTFFGGNAAYGRSIETLDTYARLRRALDAALGRTGRLLDVGNGGVFDYDTALAERITALDLFLDVFDVPSLPAHVELVAGSALDIPAPGASFDTVLVVMLIHHLVGETVSESLANLDRCIAEARRVLRPGGRLVVAESCVPPWFYALERIAFAPASHALDRVLTHPVTLQYPMPLVRERILRQFSSCEVTHVPKGRFVLQLGVKVPSILTPVQVYVFTAR
jgi:SAM-dependent methyltransferase